MQALVSTHWLADHLGEPGLRIVDCSWHMPATGRSGRKEYAQAHIPGAVFLDIDEMSDRSNPAPQSIGRVTVFSFCLGENPLDLRKSSGFYFFWRNYALC